MSKLKITILTMVALTIFSSSAIVAQEETTPAAEEKTSPFDAGLDIYSSYIWRGSKFGSGPAVQPWVEAGFGGFAVGAWGSVNASTDEALEMDLYLGYSFDFGLSINVTDYYFGGDWTKAGTTHYIEPSIGYEIGGFSVSGAYMLLPETEIDSVTTTSFGEEGDMYFELGYAFKNFSIGLGAGDGQYTDNGKFNLCNITIGTSKDIKITDSFTLPLSGAVTLNPSTGGFFIAVGVSF